MRYPQSLADVAAGDLNPIDIRQDRAASLSEMAARRRSIPVFRPPGAIEEASFLSGCTRCEACIVACPHSAIIHAPARLREAAGTPIIDPDLQPCLMCADFPCIAACEPGVLTRKIAPAMGTARVTEHLCVAYHGQSCTVCAEECPVPGAIVLEGGKPTVRESICTGCGVCRHVCPAPENAILLMPTFLRPMPTGSASP
jgi:ferredoxin-type protein NapG